MDLLSTLNEEQRKAVTQVDGPVLILAGAGSGKTKALTHRIAYLITEKKVSPYNILAVTFTNKAAREMLDRVERLLGDGHRGTKLPWMGTFHRTCLMLLRRELSPSSRPNLNVSADGVVTPPDLTNPLAIYGPNFSIYDDDDALVVVKRAMSELGIDTKKFNPRAIKNFIDGAKNELLTPSQYEPFAHGYFAEHVAKVYRRYQAMLHAANAMDFDDIIMNTVLLLQKNPEILAKYQQQFRYIMIDEYQDTNHAQYTLVKLLASAHQNICVVGDDYQCVAEDTTITTGSLKQPVYQLAAGNQVQAANGFGTSHPFSLTDTKSRPYKGPMVTITTKGGRTLRVTPEHICFARLQVTENQWYVYLMYRADKGYRIGITRGVRSGSKGLTNDLQVRANQERADKMWIIATTNTLAEARYLEEFLSIKYSLPKVLFYAYKREELAFTQQHIDRLYTLIDTRANAQDLMNDFLLFDAFPHFRPQGVTAELSEYYPGRCQAYLVQFGDSHTDKNLPWHGHRVRLTTSNTTIQNRLIHHGNKLRADKKSKRIETSRKHMNDAFSLVQRIAREGEVEVAYLARLTKEDKNFSWQPASHLRPGMLVPVLEGGTIKTDEIVSANISDYEGVVYDLNVEHAHNFAANDIVIHNSIYSWRGADFRNILNFEKDYPQAAVIKLEQNYRSTQTILDAAHEIISRNVNRSDKKLWTENPSGLPVTVIECENDMDESDFVISEIRALYRQLGSYNNFVVLYRMNAQSRLMEEAMLRHSIPYRLIGALRFYERKEVKDVLAFLRYIANPKDLASLTRVINVPPRGIGEKTFEKVLELMRSHEQGERLAEALPPKAAEFFALMQRFRELGSDIAPAELIDQVVRQTGYKSYIDDGTVEGEARWQNIEELLAVASQAESLQQFLEDVALVADVDNYNADEDAVTLMTLHAAKGLEFPVVFIVGMEEGIFPHSRSLMDSTQMEEERRLCYVGMTRAKERLYLLHAGRRMGYGGLVSNPKSRFLEELPEHLIEEL